jgi:hypothetical protein
MSDPAMCMVIYYEISNEWLCGHKDCLPQTPGDELLSYELSSVLEERLRYTRMVFRERPELPGHSEGLGLLTKRAVRSWFDILDRLFDKYNA